jgi:DNA-binding beta-propeller fold protein YncE
MKTRGKLDRSLVSSYVQRQRDKFYRKLVMIGTTATLVVCFLALVTPSLAEFAYVANFGSNNVSGYRVERNGALKAVPGSPFQAGKEPFAVAVDLFARFLYTTNDGDNNVSGFYIGSNGALTPLRGSPFETGRAPSNLAVDPLGRFVYVVNGADNTSRAFRSALMVP